jgi:hypothetical protein
MLLYGWLSICTTNGAAVRSDLHPPISCGDHANAHISKLMELSGPSWAAPEVSYRYTTHGSPPRAGYYLQG